MSAEQQHRTEQDIRNEAIDLLAVIAVSATQCYEPPIDVSSFVSNVTGIAHEDVDTRLDHASAGEPEDPLYYEEANGRLQVNYASERARTVMGAAGRWSVVIGHKELSVHDLEELAKDFQDSQRTMDQSVEAQRAFGSGMSFSPNAPVKGRGRMATLAEYQGAQPGGPVFFPGAVVGIPAHRQPKGQKSRS